MQGKEMERPKLEDQWTRKIQRENKKRAVRAKNLEALNYKFNAPEVKSVADAAAAKAIKAPEEEAPKAIEAPPTAETKTAAPAEAVEEPKEEAEEQKDEETPAKKPRGRGRPAKTPPKTAKATETPKKAVRKAKA